MTVSRMPDRPSVEPGAAAANFHGKVALVTGSARGLGRVVAHHLASRGADLFLVDRDFAAVSEFGETLAGESVAAEVRALGVRCEQLECDLVDAGAAAAAIDRCVERMGRIDFLVNNAGGMLAPMETSRATQVSEAHDRMIFDINYRTTLNCCQSAARHMRRARSGVIVNVASSVARHILAQGKGASYGAAKAAVIHLTRSLALELAGDGIRVNSVAPGVVTTARIVAQAQARGVGLPDDASQIPLGRHVNAQDCALVIEFLLSEMSRFVTGQSISVCGGKHLMPS